MKRGTLAAVLLGCYLAGVTTMGLRRLGENVQPQSPAGPQIVARQPKQIVAPAPSTTSAKPQNRRADVAKISGFDAWRRIGDHYLHDTGDISLAVAGYSQAIDLASKEELDISPERDNWILMALKDARTKEKNNVLSKQK